MLQSLSKLSWLNNHVIECFRTTTLIFYSAGLGTPFITMTLSLQYDVGISGSNLNIGCFLVCVCKGNVIKNFFFEAARLHVF